MEHSPLLVNQIIHDNRDDNDYRILWISPVNGARGYWICANGKSNIPTPFLTQDIIDGMDNGRYALAADPYTAGLRLERPGKTAISYRDRAWGLIKDVVSAEPDVYDPSKRADMLRAVESDTGTKITNLYKYLGRYWRNGKIPDALLPNYGACGKSRDVYKDSAKRSGRKKAEGVDGKKLDKADLRNFQDAVNKYYLCKAGLSLEETYRKLKKDHYTVRDASGAPVSPMDPDEVPSRGQFLYWYRKNRDILAEASSRNTEKAYNLSNRGETGKTETCLYGPGMAAQIDATIADIFLVSKTDRGNIIGRPTMYFQMDSYSHIVMGMSISLDPPSWDHAAATIINSSEVKPAFCRRYGIEIQEEDWPCMHLPTVLLADRGEVGGKTADLLANALGITVENTPPYRGDLKGIIEKHFDLINLELDKLPGNVKKDFKQRCTDDYRLDAVLDFDQFVAIIIQCVLTYNNYHYMPDFRRTQHMRQLGVKPIPRELWNYGIRYQTGGLRTMPYEHVRFSLLPKGEASVTRRGIHFNGLYYSCEKAEEEKWYDMARTQNSWKVSAAYDPRDAALIYICPNAGESPLECHLLERDWMYEGLSAEETARQNAADNLERERYRKMEDFARLKLDEFIDGKVKKARELSASATGKKSKARRVAGIDKNRKSEKQALKDESTNHTLENRGYRKSSDSQDMPEQNVEAISPITRMLKEALDEALGKE